MMTRTLAPLMLALLLAGACSSGSSEAEVLGVVVERSDVAQEGDATGTDDPEEPGSRAEIREAPAVSDRGLATLSAAEEPTPDAPAPPPREPISASPSSEPAPQPAALAEGPGNAYTWTPPQDPPQEGVWWVESSSLPAQDRDADPWNGARVATRDVQRAEDQDTSTEPVRRAACDPWLEAPGDRPVEGVGTVIVELDVNGAVAATASYRFDGTIEPGTRHAFDRVGDVQVDARDGDTAVCSVRFEAD